MVVDAAFVLASATAAVCCAAAARQEQGWLGRVWALLCAATSLWTMGNLIWFYYQVVADHQPFPALSDVTYIAALLTAIAALLSFPTADTDGSRQVRTLLDGVMMASAFVFVSWIAVLGPVYRTAGLGPLARTVFVLYPALDVVIVTVALLMAARTQAQARLPLVLVALGLASYGVADSLYAYKTAQGDFAIGTLLDLGWISGYLVVALAALAPTRRATGATVRGSRSTLVSTVVPSAPVFFALAVGEADELGKDQFLALVGFGLLFSFAARQFITLQENSRLSRDLERKVELRTADLERLSRRTESILDSAGEGIYGVDRDGLATFDNASAAALTGYTAKGSPAGACTTSCTPRRAMTSPGPG